MLRQWIRSSDTNLLSTAAWTYQEMRHIDLDFALNGLEQIVRVLDLSPLKTILAFDSAMTAESDDELLEDYLMMQADIDRDATNPVEIVTRFATYLKTVEEADDSWGEVEPVYNAVEFAIIVIAFDYLRETINLLCDWVNEEDAKGCTIQLAGSLIWLRLANELADDAKREGKPSRILELIDRDEESWMLLPNY